MLIISKFDIEFPPGVVVEDVWSLSQELRLGRPVAECFFPGTDVEKAEFAAYLRLLRDRESEYQWNRWHGHTWGEIARRMGISHRTVHQYARECWEKWNLAVSYVGNDAYEKQYFARLPRAAKAQMEVGQ